jgi:hypothetical protein
MADIMSIFSAKKDKKEEQKAADVPDELPSLYEPEVLPPTPQPKAQAPPRAEIVQGLPKEPSAPVELPPIQPPVQSEIALSTPEVPTPEESDKPRKLIDRINLIDSLREQLDSTEKEIAGLTESLAEQRRLLQRLRSQLSDEIEIVKLDLGLAPVVVAQKRSAPIPVPKLAKQDLAPGEYFYFVHGAVARSISEMSQELGRISDDVFRYHCNAEKNDFYQWIRNIFGDVQLADKIQHLSSKLEIVRALSS